MIAPPLADPPRKPMSPGRAVEAGALVRLWLLATTTILLSTGLEETGIDALLTLSSTQAGVVEEEDMTTCMERGGGGGRIVAWQVICFAGGGVGGSIGLGPVTILCQETYIYQCTRS